MKKLLEYYNQNVILICQGTLADEFFKQSISFTNKVRGVIVFCRKLENYIYLQVDQPLVH